MVYYDDDKCVNWMPVWVDRLKFCKYTMSERSSARGNWKSSPCSALCAHACVVNPNYTPSSACVCVNHCSSHTVLTFCRSRAYICNNGVVRGYLALKCSKALWFFCIFQAWHDKCVLAVMEAVEEQQSVWKDWRAQVNNESWSVFTDRQREGTYFVS